MMIFYAAEYHFIVLYRSGIVITPMKWDRCTRAGGEGMAL